MFAMAICLTSFEGVVTRHDINNVFLPIGPNVECLDRNFNLVKAIRLMFALYIVGMLLFIIYALVFGL